MSRLPSFEKPVFLVACALVLWGSTSIAQKSPSPADWQAWVGRKVDISYDCCGVGTCELILGSKLIRVTDKNVVVLVKGSPFLVHRYMINSMVLSREE